MENFIVNNVKSHEDRKLRALLIEAAQETNPQKRNEAFQQILEIDREKDVYKLDDTKLLIKNFAFEPIPHTITTLMVHLNKIRNPTDHIMKLGDLEFYNALLEHNVTAGTPDNPERQWSALARTAGNDVTLENSAVLYTDKSKNTVDWVNTMVNLKDIAHKLHYSEEHIEKMLLRLGMWFEGSSIELVLRNMNINEKAQHLMSKTPRPNPYVQLLQRLHALVRYKGQALYQILNESYGIGLALYYKEKPEVKQSRLNKLMLHCLLNFTVEPVKTTIKAMVDQAIMNQKELPYWQDLAHSAEQTEVMTSMPDMDLPYKKKSGETIELFNLRLGSIDQNQPGIYKDATDHMRFEKMPTKYKPSQDFYGPNKQGPRKDFQGPSLDQPIGSSRDQQLQDDDDEDEFRGFGDVVGYNEDIQRESRNVQEHLLREAHQAHEQLLREPEQEPQRGVLGQQFTLNKPAPLSQIIRSPANQSPAASKLPRYMKNDKAQTDRKKKQDYGVHPMDTRYNSGTNPNKNAPTTDINYYSAGNDRRYRSQSPNPRRNNYRSWSRDRNGRSRDYKKKDYSRNSSYDNRKRYNRSNDSRQSYRRYNSNDSKYKNKYRSRNNSRNSSRSNSRTSSYKVNYSRRSSYNGNNRRNSYPRRDGRGRSNSRDSGRWTNSRRYSYNNGRNRNSRNSSRSTSRNGRSSRYDNYKSRRSAERNGSTSRERGKRNGYESDKRYRNASRSSRSNHYRNTPSRRSSSPRNEADLHNIADDTDLFSGLCLNDEPAKETDVLAAMDPLHELK